MAYRSQAREGSFSNNFIQIPDEVRKLQSEGQRQLTALQSTQAFNAKQQQLYNDAARRADNIELENAKAVARQRDRNLRREMSAAERAWQVQLENNRRETEEANDRAKRAFDFASAVTGVTQAYSDIQKINKDNQLKATNEIQFQNQFSVDDLHAAKSVDANISNSEWQRTQIVADYLRAGKSQEFINAMYEHLIKGGGYRNYVTNVGVLTETARIHAIEQQELINQDLAPEELRRRLAQLQTQQRASLLIDGRIPGPQILEKGYNATIRRMQHNAEVAINQRIKNKTAEDNEIDQNLLIRNALKGGDVNGWNLEAAFTMTSTSTRPGHIKDTVRRILSQAETSEEVAQLGRYKIEKDGKRIPITFVDKDIQDMIDAKAEVLAAKEVKDLETQKKILQAQANTAQLRYLKDIQDQKGFFDLEDYRQSVDIADSIFGYGRDKSLDDQLKLDTLEEEFKPFAEEEIKEMIENKTLSEKMLMEMGLPSDLKNKYTSAAQRLDNMRGSSEYKEARKVIEGRIEGALAQNPATLKFVQGETQADHVRWFVNTYTNKFFSDYQDALLANEPNALDVIGDSAAAYVDKYFKDIGKAIDPITGRIAEYAFARNKNVQRSVEIRENINYWNSLTPNEKTYPQQWINSFGVKQLQVATEELRETGTSETFMRIGAELGISQYEAQRQLAAVAEEFDEVEAPISFQEFMDNFTPDESNILLRGIHTNERKIDLLRSRLTDIPPAIRPSFQQAQTSSNPTQTRWEELGVQVGFSPEEAKIMSQIIMAESGGDAAIDTVKSGLDPNKTNEYSIGGPQINVAVHQDKLAARGFTEEDMRDPLKSMQIAKDVFDEQGFGAWTTYVSGKYKNFSQASEGARSFTGALTYEDNKETYKAAGQVFVDAGFRVGEQSDFDEVDAVHSSNSYHNYNEAFDITHQTGDYDESIAKTGRLQELIESLDLFYEVIGPLSNDPDHATHLHLGGLKRPMTAEDIRRIKSLK